MSIEYEDSAEQLLSGSFTDSSKLVSLADCRGAGTIPPRRHHLQISAAGAGSGAGAGGARPEKQAVGGLTRTTVPSAGTVRFARDLKAAMPATRNGTPTKMLLARRATDATALPHGSSVAEALGHDVLARGTAAQSKPGRTDGSWTSSAPAGAAIHESRWSHSDVDYSADPRARRAIEKEVNAARRSSGWQAATHAVTPEARHALAKQTAVAQATVARQSAGAGIAMVFDDSESPSTGVSLAQRYSASRRHEVEMHKAVASSRGSGGLLHPRAHPHAAAARRTGAERMRQSEERKQTSARAADWGRDATRGNAVGRAAWVMDEQSLEKPAQPAASRKNSTSPGFCLS